MRNASKSSGGRLRPSKRRTRSARVAPASAAVFHSASRPDAPGIFHKAASCIRCIPDRVRDGAAGHLAIHRSSRAIPECATLRLRATKHVE